MAAAGFSSEWSPARRALGAWMPGARQGSKKTGLDARRGPKTWERPADGFE